LAGFNTIIDYSAGSSVLGHPVVLSMLSKQSPDGVATTVASDDLVVSRLQRLLARTNCHCLLIQQSSCVQIKESTGIVISLQ